MQFASANRDSTGQPFFLVMGIKRPHLNWRVPQEYADLFPEEEVAVPAQLTLDESIDPIAYSVFPMTTPTLNGTHERADFVKSPYVHGDDAQLRVLRQHYYAAVAWADYAAGQILNELDKLSLTVRCLFILFYHGSTSMVVPLEMKFLYQLVDSQSHQLLLGPALFKYQCLFVGQVRDFNCIQIIQL